MEVTKQLAKPIINFFKMFSGEEKPQLTIPEVNNVFGFYSPTGGTGVSTLVVNLATVLASRKKVAVLDLDLFHPALFRYFIVDGGGEDFKLQHDIYDKFIAAGEPVVSFGHKTCVQNVTLFTSLPEADIIRYCKMDYHGICACIKDLSRTYDCVLIDIKGNLLQESVIAAIETSTRVYTFIRPTAADLENAYKDMAILSLYSFGAKTKNLIQSPVGTAPIDAAEIKKVYNMDSILAIPYVKKVEDIGYNYDIFVRADGGSDKHAKKYLACVTWLAERIVNYGLEEVEVNVSE